jgi:hypothetical protein
MSEAVFDFAAINRRMNRKPEPVAVVDVVSTPNVTFGGCKYAPNLAKKLYTVPIMEPPRNLWPTVASLRASLDETETVFIGWDFGKSA